VKEREREGEDPLEGSTHALRASVSSLLTDRLNQNEVDDRGKGSVDVSVLFG
jgi:hypothetical protein